MTPPLVFFYPHFSCVRARDLKFYDFLNNIKTNLVMLFFCQKVNFCGHRALAKNGRKKASQLFRAINQKKHFFNFFSILITRILCKHLKKVGKKFQKCPQDQVYLSPGSWYQVVQQTLNLSRYFIFYPINVIFCMQPYFIYLYNIFFSR